MTKTSINHIRIVTEDRTINNGSIIFEDGVITGISDNPEAHDIRNKIDGSGLTAIPGFIDTHCHGGNGADANDGTVGSIETLANFHLRHGVTGMYATLATDDFNKIIKGFEIIREYMHKNPEGNILGAHLEGPFLNIKYKGSQSEKYFIPFDEKYLPVINTYKDIIKRITLSPELEHHLQRISELTGMGIVVSGGHSDADYDLMLEAAALGMNSVTHLYNAMSQVHKEGPFRICGMTEAALTLDTLYAEIIADGYHVPVPLIQIAYRCKGADKLLICSDANGASGCKDGGVYHVYGHTFIVENGIALNEQRTSLAGSVTPLDAMFRNLITLAGIPLEDAVKMASTNPAKMMGIDQRKGSLKTGKDADINLLDNEYRLAKTFCKGKEVKY
ncbi:MAG: N-acetylglucosamine-6-phosphate deacetylase [Bacteroidales bacterium]|jgi:N-acetylglucosamine-6-phosphate deacetylase|nr:N-acetylglucosamine-6-phosphate deacetylase [Bacteroidales bacterium]